jgi:hypothetical protein
MIRPFGETHLRPLEVEDFAAAHPGSKRGDDDRPQVLVAGSQ